MEDPLYLPIFHRQKSLWKQTLEIENDALCTKYLIQEGDKT